MSEASDTSRKLDQPDEHTLELYKMEYEKCADRYENIYKAVWTNFSYIAVVSGAILTFGSTRLNPNHAALIACLPLIFWFWATFLPLDAYGDKANRRLKRVEGVLNSTFKVKLDHYTGFYDTRHTTTSKIGAWKSPRAMCNDITESTFKGFYLRTRHTVIIFLLLVHLTALLLTYKVYFNSKQAVLCYLAASVIGAVFAPVFIDEFKPVDSEGSYTNHKSDDGKAETRTWRSILNLKLLLLVVVMAVASCVFVYACLNIYAPKPNQEAQRININLNLDGHQAVIKYDENGRPIEVQTVRTNR